MLGEQLVELKAEIEGVEMRFCYDYGLEPGRGAIDPSKPGPLLEQHSRQLRLKLSQQQRELRMLADSAATKRWLKQRRQLLREPVSGFDPLYGEARPDPLPVSNRPRGRGLIRADLRRAAPFVNPPSALPANSTAATPTHQAT
ncbi:hypothetical protein ABIC89_006505 [Variovorax boronicumulans]|uniref:hypothetical protein n=1 Tax=Variovorax boronicumulans TaxID=436515 RepID=UPI00339B66DF